MLTCSTDAKLRKTCPLQAYTSIEPLLLTSFSCLFLNDPIEINRARYLLHQNINILSPKQQK